LTRQRDRRSLLILCPAAAGKSERLLHGTFIIDKACIVH
jgi:hypothetical protein